MGIRQALVNLINVIAENRKKCVHTWELVDTKTVTGKWQTKEGSFREEEVTLWTYKCTKPGCDKINQFDNKIEL